MERMVDYILHIENNVLVRVEPIFEWDFEDYWNYDVIFDGDDEYIFDDDDEDAGEIDVLNPVEQEIPLEVPLKKSCERKNSSEIDTIIIPEGVMKISSLAFKDCKEVEKIVLPGSLEVIDARAFYDCRCLENLEIPKGVVHIGKQAFAGCSKLSEIELPMGLKKIEDHLFSCCDNLQKIKIPEGIEEIGEGVFFRCRKLCELKLPKSLKKIGARFFESEAGMEGVILPASVTKVHYSNFESGRGTILSKSGNGEQIYRKGIDWIKIDSGNTTYCIVDDMLLTADRIRLLYCFRNAQGKITIPDSVECIGRYAFFDCGEVTEIQIPDSVMEIGMHAFDLCRKLKKIVLPPKLSILSEGVFLNCTKLEDIKIHKNISYIAPWAFSGCDSLEYIKIPSSVQCIGENAFSKCARLKQVDIAEDVKKIGKEAFRSCGRLYEIRIPDSVESIEEDVFSRCEDVTITCYSDSEAERYAILNEIKRNYDWLDISEEELLERQREWDEYMISCETKQENSFYKIKDGIVYSKDGTVLIRCPKDYKGSVVVLDGVISIRKEAFYECGQVENVVLPEGLCYIGEYAFSECVSLKEISFPETLIAIGKGAFAYCEKLEYAPFGKQLRVLGEEAFWGTNVKEVVLPKTLTSDCGERIFAGCDSLYLVRIPQFFEGLEMENCFQFFVDCENLQRIIIEENGRECTYEDEGEYYTLDDLAIFKRWNSLAYCPPGRKGVLYIPEGIVGSEKWAFSYKCKITGVVFPDSWDEQLISGNIYADKNTSEILYDCRELEFVEVSKANKRYMSENGLLLTKDGKQLLYCPKKKKGIVEIPEGMESSLGEVFADCSLITEIHYPKTYQSLDRYRGCDSLREIHIYDTWKLFGRSIKELGTLENVEKFFDKKIKIFIEERETE